MNKDGDQSSQPTATLCNDCYSAVGKGIAGKRAKPKRPKFSIANGVDFGRPDRLNLPALTVAEEILLGDGHEMATIIKLKGSQPSERQAALKGHIITVKKSKTELIKEINRIEKEKVVLPRPENIKETLSVVIVGAKMSFASLEPAYKYKSIQVRPDVLYKWFKAKKQLDPQYKNIEIDSSPEIIEKLLAIPKQLVDSASFLKDDKSIAVEKIVDKLAQGVSGSKAPHVSNTKEPNTDGDNEEAVFVTRSHPAAPSEEGAAEQVLKSKRKRLNPHTNNHFFNKFYLGIATAVFSENSNTNINEMPDDEKSQLHCQSK